MLEYCPNAEQLAVHADVEIGRGHTVVSARAGTGKTRTLVSVLSKVPERDKTLFVAFNADIAKTIAKRVPSGRDNLEVKTLHALGLKACGRAFGGVEVDKDRGRRIAEEVSGADKDARLKEWSFAIRTVVTRCKNTLSRSAAAVDHVIDILQPDHPEAPVELLRCRLCRRWSPVLSDVVCGHQGCKGELIREVKDDRPEFIRQVLECMDRATYKLVPSDVGDEPERAYPTSVDFDDMCFLPVAMALKMPKFDRVFVDEAQDLNALQIQLVLGTIARGGRICAVGDPFQSIYKFRGAAAGAIDRIVHELDAKVLPMTTTYRCGRLIAQEAATLVPDFKAAPGMHDGCVHRDVSADRMMREARPGDFILSRINAPLIGMCLSFMREGRRAHILGRDLGAKLNGIVRRAKAVSIPKLREYVLKWAQQESERLLAKGESDEIVRDTQACLDALIEGCVQVYDVQAKISGLFDDVDEDTAITLSTTHKAKGMERDRVWLLRDTYLRRQNDEERNLLYVAITRAKNDLFMVRGRVGEL